MKSKRLERKAFLVVHLQGAECNNGPVADRIQCAEVCFFVLVVHLRDAGSNGPVVASRERYAGVYLSRMDGCGSHGWIETSKHGLPKASVREGRLIWSQWASALPVIEPILGLTWSPPGSVGSKWLFVFQVSWL